MAIPSYDEDDSNQPVQNYNDEYPVISIADERNRDRRENNREIVQVDQNDDESIDPEDNGTPP